MVKSIYLFSIFSILSTGIFAQSIEFSVARYRTDYLIEAGYGYYKQQHKVSGFAGIGMIKTLSQQRFNPRIGVEYAYDFLDAEKLLLGPILGLYSSTYLITKSPKSRIWNEELLAGVHFEFGNQLKFGSSLMYGFMTEHYSDNFYLSYGFNAKIGLIYCW